MYYSLLFYFVFLIFLTVFFVFLLKKFNLKNPVRFAVFLILIISLPVIFAYFYFFTLSPLPETVVPDVVGLNEYEAMDRISKMGLKATIEERGSSSALVTNQRPEPGKIVKTGRVIFISIGKDGDEVPIPSAVVVSPILTQESVGSPEIRIEIEE